jgi:hypothetical protein
LLCACTATSPDPRGTALSPLGQPSCRDTELPWGPGPAQIGLRPGGEEHLGRGPQAVAVAPDGDVLVLDTVNGRVVAIDPRGDVRIAVDGLARDAEDLAVGADGAIAVWSPLQGKAWVFGDGGAAEGTISVDRALRQTVGISLGASRQLLVRSAYQETLSAGSPAAPVDLATMLAGKREGAFLLADGRGVSTRKTADGAALIVTANPAGRRATTLATHPIPGPADAAMPFGVAGDLACVRTERVEQPADRLSVTRRAVCLHATTGRVVTDLALGAPGPYLPAHELAVGGTTPVLAVLQPSTDHVVVRTCEVAR